MEYNVGDYNRQQQIRLQQVQRRMIQHNPDYMGHLSSGIMVLIFGLMLGASAVFAYEWWLVSQKSDQTGVGIHQLQSEYNSLALYVGNFSTRCNCSVNGTQADANVTFPTEFGSSNFSLYNSVVTSKILRFNLDGLGGGGGGTLNLLSQNRSGEVALVDDLPTYPHQFLDTVFTLVNSDDPTGKRGRFNTSLISSATTRILGIPDQSGVIARTVDIPIPTSVFAASEFAVKDSSDQTKEMMFDLDTMSAGTNVTIAVPDADGTIACRSDLPPINASFSDAVFSIDSTLNDMDTVRFDVSSQVPTGTVSVMSVQASPQNGTIAYSDQVQVYIDVTINSSRTFPDSAFEGVSTLEALGVTQLQIWLCGGGGGGGGSDGGTTAGGGGGSGSGIEKFFVDNAADLFSSLTCTIGAGGIAGIGSTSSPTMGGDGGTSSVVGVSKAGVSSFLEIYGYGGGGGQFNGTGGAGGGSGGSAVGEKRGGAGTEGGLAGGIPGDPGAFRYPWHAGSGGGQSLIYDPAPWYGGGAAGTNGGATGGGGGAGGMFGTGGDGGVSLNNYGIAGGRCAGGGGAALTDSANAGGAGGDGRIVIRYWTI